MLDTTTKRRIDTARDILVGKIPDPKSQVEQITIALIYKFMDDMDAESEELGGTRNFFAGEFARYGWAKLMRSGLGGHETLNLYAEAIARMPENPGIPLLFRNIFKNAYLPYRDPETLRAFLKIIDEFSYDHSERLGDAFEYLLSVLGSQGDAGQFRTPRHIIDFIVAIVNPKKHETILDPACGTAGFLISSYKHILNNNLDENGYTTLTPDDKGCMVGNFSGYDISPDMVRLSLVNLYLHGFSDPHIFEYDTLTSQDRWNEHADVILANPPFMSPKGGIRPHNRFSVQSKRSEVLFVDYITDHLTPDGRAGVIVPEGIIFQSQNAYKQLRKKLIEESLVAVISLPAGVFQPYSGVKTSILILDKALAKKADTIAFFKVENDGFGLGAQRRPIDKNDLPQVLEEVKGYLDYIRKGDSSEEYLTQKGLVVKREKVAENGEYNLSGERHRVSVISNAKYPFVEIGSICQTFTGGTPQRDRKEYYDDGMIPWVKSGEVNQGFIKSTEEYINEVGLKNSSARLFPIGTVLVAMYGATAGKVGLLKIEAATNQAICGILPNDTIIPEFLYYLLSSRRDSLVKLSTGGAQPNISQTIVRSLKIPLPPLEIQKEIVAEIGSYQKVIDGARAVVENYRPHIPIDPAWPLVAIGDVVDFVSGLTVSIPEVESEDGTPIIAINNVTEEGNLTLKGLRKIRPPKKKLNYLHKGDLLFNWRNGSTRLVGKTALFDLDGEYLFASFLLGLRVKPEKISNIYLWHMLNIFRKEGRYLQLMRQNVNGLFNRDELKITKIPLPPIPDQQIIIAEIEAEQNLVNANRELINRFENKIETIIKRIF